MLPFTNRNAKPGLSRRTRGQAMAEYIWITAGLLLGTLSLMTFAPDSVAALTIYIQGFYLILGLPLG